ncbi:MAG: sugar ABC transporter substrate-binding protein [Candidatus Izimaplasma sp.]|nr:sugar ABC transporter substrate-binding protein [Candidatus Izimaplasma bacterium]
MKKVLSLLVLLVAVFTLVGCGGKDETLQMLWWSDGTEGDVMQDLLDDYEAETGVVIELVPVAYNDYEARLATMISGGEAPALARVTEGHLNNFKDSILPLDDVYTTSGFTNLFFNSDDEVISLPMDITANGLFVNLDLLDEYNVDYPTSTDEGWTWENFETEMSKLKDQSNVANPGIFDHQAHRFMPLLYQNGVEIWETPYTESNLTSDDAVEVVQMLMDFYETGFLPRDAYVTKDSASLFRTGQYGFHLSGNWNVSNYQDLDFNWTVVRMPEMSNRATILGGKSLAAFKDSGLEEEAQDFIAWMAEAEQHDYYTGTVPYLTPRLGATVDYGDFTAEYNVFLSEIAATDNAYVQDWLAQVMIPGMYPIINQFVEDAASGTEGTALDLLTQLEADLKAAAPTE